MSRQQTTVVNGHYTSHSPTQRPKLVYSSTSNSHPLAAQQQSPCNPQVQGVRRPLQKPQISIEEADGPCSPLSPPKSPPYDRLASPTATEPVMGDTRSARGSPYNNALRSEPDSSPARKSSPQHLSVKKTSLKSNSLPLGMTMAPEEAGLTSSRSPTDSECSDDTELSPLKESMQNGTHHSHSVRKKRSETLDSLYSESDSGSSSEDEKMSPILQTIPDDAYDDVFQDVEIELGSDSKLIDWAFNVFVPACCTLLNRCEEMKAEREKSSSPTRSESVGATAALSDCIQSDLRSLSNTINYFCSEQQRLSGLLKAKITSSVSTDRMTKIAVERAATLQTRQSSSNTSSFSEVSSGSFDSHDSQTDRSYAVKILRSVSQSLIQPLLYEAEDGFTYELYKSIVQALQKISWKVEACLSFNDPCKGFEIHAKIFSPERAPGIKAMMIGALPPEEPKLQVVATHASRSNSISSPKRKKDSSSSLTAAEYSEGGRVIRRTPSGRRRPGGTVFDSGTLPDSLNTVSPESINTVTNGKAYDGDKTPQAQGSAETTPTTPMRTRTATTSEIELSPSHRSKYGAHSRFAKVDSFDEDSACPQYFRPKAARRTTISLSRREVTNLGLTVAKRVEESVIHEVGSTDSRLHDRGVLTEDDMRRRLHESLTEEFDRINESTKSSSYFERVKSASMSDLLEDNFESQTPPRRHDSFQGLAGGKLSASGDNGSVGTLDSNDDIVSVSSARIEQSYVPAQHHPTNSSVDTSCEAEWVYVSGTATLDPRMGRQSSVQSEPTTPLKKEKKSKTKNKSDKTKRTLTGSGKFTDKLLKTAQALRRASVVSKPKKVERIRVKSEDMLCDPESPSRDISFSHSKSHSKHSKSEPPSPIPRKQSHADTMPASKKHKSLKRFIAKKSKSFNSKDSLGRKVRGKSEFLQDYEHEMERECSLSLLNESIENYSKIAMKPRITEGISSYALYILTCTCNMHNFILEILCSKTT